MRDDDRYMLTVECTGEAALFLKDLLKSLKWLGEVGASRPVCIVADGDTLNEMRAKGLPTNVFFDGDGSAKIGDVQIWRK